MGWRSALLVTVLLAWQGAGADDYTGADLAKGAVAWERARAGGGAENKSAQDAYDSGLFQGMTLGVAESNGANGVWCPPPVAKYGQFWAVVAKYVKAHPEKWHERASQLVYNALIEAFPCP